MMDEDLMSRVEKQKMQAWFALVDLLSAFILFFRFFFNVASGRFACNISLPETHFTTQWRMFFTYLLLQANRLSYFALNMYLLILLYFSLAILLQLRAHDKEKSVSENCQRV